MTPRVPIAGGGGFMPRAADPSPSPSPPSAEAQFFSYNAFPSARLIALVGRSSAPSVPSAATNRVVESREVLRRPLRYNRRRQRIENRLSRSRPIPAEPGCDFLRVLEERDGFLILDIRDHLAARVYRLAVLFDGDPNDAREALGRTLLPRERGYRSRAKHATSAALWKTREFIPNEIIGYFSRPLVATPH